MGSGESTTRKVSFGVDDEERVRILRGVKLSEDVLQRMKGVANIAPERPPPSTSSPQKDKGASQSSDSRPKQSPQHRAPPSSQSSKPASFAKEEQKRFERQQTMLKDELAKMAQREKEAAKEDTAKAMTQERQHTRQEAEKTKQLISEEFHRITSKDLLGTFNASLDKFVPGLLRPYRSKKGALGQKMDDLLENLDEQAQQLQKKDTQLKALDAFYKEQLAQLEKRNWERFEESKEEFHQAASKTEANVRSRNTTAVCPGLQAQILSCYKDNSDQTLKCSDLAKEYMQCINAAKKNLQVNHG